MFIGIVVANKQLGGSATLSILPIRRVDQLDPSPFVNNQ